MRSSYQGQRTSPRGRRRRGGGLVAILPLFIVVLGVTSVLLLTGVLGGPQKPAAPKDPGQQNEPVEPTDPTQPTDPVEPTDPTQPTDPVEPTDPADPTDPLEPGGYTRIEINGDQEQYPAVYRIGDSGFEMYTYIDGTADKYAKAVNAAGEKLSGVNVYAVIVPLSSGITLPDDLLGKDIFGDQKKAEEKIVTKLGDKVTVVPLYDVLMNHRGEYIYYRTDHHWTALGAYYGYRAFCRAAGITAHQLTDYKTEEFTGFLGSFYKDSNQNEQMGANPDTVVAYRPVTTTAQLVFTDRRGQETPWRIITDVSDWNSGMKYNTFIGGDNPFTVITNPEVEGDSACVVIKESFGNAMVPFLVDHYHTVYVLDYRYWNGDLQTFVREKNAQDVVFINNLSAIRNSSLMGDLQLMVG